MRYKQLLYLIFPVLLLTISACKDDCVTGDGFRTAFSRPVAPFNKIDLQISATIELKHDTAEIASPLVISAESNVMNHVITTVKDSTLTISFDACIENHNDITVLVPYRKLEELIISGPGDYKSLSIIEQDSLKLSINGQGDAFLTLDVGNFTTEINSSGALFLSGGVDTFNIINASTGTVNAYNGIATNVNAVLQSSGGVFVRVSNKLEAVIAGSGNLYYKGFPVLDTLITGSGKLINDN